MRAALIIAAVFAIAPGTAAAAKTRRAENVAREALALYRDGRYAEAAAKFMRAYGLSSEPIQLRNAAKASDRAGEPELALERWRAYLVLAEDPEDRGEAEAAIAALEPPAEADELVIREPEPAEVEPPPPLPEPVLEIKPPLAVETTPPPPAEKTTAPYWMLGAGGAAIAASVAMFIDTESRRGELSHALTTTDDRGLTIGIAYRDALAEESAIERDRGIAAAGAAIGGALLAGGIIWLAFGELGGDQP